MNWKYNGDTWLGLVDIFDADGDKIFEEVPLSVAKIICANGSRINDPDEEAADVSEFDDE